MITFTNTETYGWEAAIRGMRNPMNSWDKSDSHPSFDLKTSKISLEIGPNDLDLMKRLIKAGPTHRKFLRSIIVSVDITAPWYWYKEFDTYKVGTVSNSCSTMHKIMAKEFTLDDFSHEHMVKPTLDQLKADIELLNDMRNWWLVYDSMKEKDKELFIEGITCKKDLWWQIIQKMPVSYNQTRTITMNYEVLYNICHTRDDHKLDEWRISFMDWAATLPHSDLIIK